MRFSSLFFSSILSLGSTQSDSDMPEGDLLELQQLFQEFSSFYGKEYDSSNEVAFRFETFSKNYEMIKNTNEKKNFYKLGVNQFADMSVNEFASMYDNPDAAAPLNAADFDPVSQVPIYNPTMNLKDIHSEKFIDWRLTRCFGVVKNQGSCNSCWAFAANALMEVMTCVSKQIDDSFKANDVENKALPHEYVPEDLDASKLDLVLPRSRNSVIPSSDIDDRYVALSEQFLLDCNVNDHEKPQNEQNFRCLGGMAANAIRFSSSEGGFFSQEKYPYTEVPTSCSSSERSQDFIKMKEITAVEENNLLLDNEIVNVESTVAAVRAALKFSPVGISICSNTTVFIHYESGIMHDEGEACNKEELRQRALHAVMIVGYAEEVITNMDGSVELLPYFVIRNSHSHTWGEGGYGRIRAVDPPVAAGGEDKKKSEDLSDLGWRMRPFAWVKRSNASFKMDAVEADETVLAVVSV
eukprot:GDKJ01002429.1.p1 GENE.GDKJ01002429.1~~GDKJ01002429.1.p1  ORF type:complete len:467 (+),score=111.28 GDKJ01002429.1:54-1454(+)